MSTTDILTTVANQWRAAVNAHDPKLVASYFTPDAIFQGLHPYSVGPEGVAEYYAAQPLGMTADYTVLETRQLTDDLILGYLTVDFAFVDRPTKTVNLALLLKKTPEAWQITHYQVSLLP
ncbi:SgcJ/EcaC family oxidoreductase [Kribbella lupini]|uniref:Nuclear transport factor 2 family protein n=1 Tax=Kribbella lupini TaxID=291602 RepID=A0ABN2C668_9ACTN